MHAALTRRAPTCRPRVQVERLEARVEAGAEPGELEALRRENAALRLENANMFTLMEENAALRTQLETARLQLQCLGGEETPHG